MQITKLEAMNKNKVNVFIDFEYAFFLYWSDIRSYSLKEGMELTAEDYEAIIKNVVIIHAKKKALAILKYMDRTEAELGQKLKQAGFGNDVIAAAIDYVNEYHYLDDERFASNYIKYKSSFKSRRQISMELARKGIDKRVIERAMEQELENDDTAISKAIRKKTDDINKLSKEELQKLSASLYRKGFSSEDIRKYLKVEN